MIKAAEAIQLANSYKDNYRKQERIALENRITAEIEKAARGGKYECFSDVSNEDVNYIINLLSELGYVVKENHSQIPTNEFTTITIKWPSSAENKKKVRSLAGELLKRLEQQA